MSEGLAKLFRESMEVEFWRDKFKHADTIEEIKELEKKKGGRKLALASKLIAQRIKILRKRAAKMEAEKGKAVFTALTEQDKWQISLHTQAMRRVLEKDIPKNLPRNTLKEYVEAMNDSVAVLAMIRGVECVLKKPEKVDGSWERMFTRDEMEKLVQYDTRVVVDLWMLYCKQVELSEAELGESFRPAVN